MDPYDYIIACLCNWREARGEPMAAKVAQAWTVKNRVLKAGWMGKDVCSVVLKPYQFSAFNSGDVNSTKFPMPADISWLECREAVQDVWDGTAQDNTMGATHYFDSSLDLHLPAWAKDGSMVQTISIGGLRFWK